MDKKEERTGEEPWKRNGAGQQVHREKTEGSYLELATYYITLHETYFVISYSCIITNQLY